MLGGSHILKAYDNDFIELRNALLDTKSGVLQIANLLKQALSGSISGSNSKYFTEAKNVKNAVGEKVKNIEELILSIIALRQPVAFDLRVIMSYFKIANLLHSTSSWLLKTIGKLDKIETEPEATVISVFLEMVDTVIEMLDITMSYLSQSGMTSLQIKGLDILEVKDTVVDTLYKDLFNGVKNLKQVDFFQVYTVITIAKNIEKAADNITDMSEIIRNMLSGQK
jgi:phosphate transport system protein